jgi:hypothetical protein
MSELYCCRMMYQCVWSNPFKSKGCEVGARSRDQGHLPQINTAEHFNIIKTIANV